MSDTTRPELILVRHGETEWSRSGRHTGRTDVALTERGREQATALQTRLAGHRFALVLTSPSARAHDTCALANLGASATVDGNLAEWDYGDLEGLTTTQIRERLADWTVFAGRVPGGEAIDDVARRADAVLDRVRHADGDAVVFSHGHFLRVLAARWLALAPVEGRHLALDPASVSVLGHEHDQPVLRHWNDTSHLHHLHALD